ncbi:MAG: hypothetical protein ACJ8AW_48580 [Rhodopila sp.]
MIDAARRGEYDYYQRGHMALNAERFIPTPDAVIRAMLEAALKITPDPAPPASPPPRGKTLPRILCPAPEAATINL